MLNTPNSSELRVLIDAPKYFIRPRNTDWRYMCSLEGLPHYGGPTALLDTNPMRVVSKSASYILARSGRSVEGYSHPLISSKLIQKKISAVLNHDTPPQIKGTEIPVVWRYGMTDPKMLEFSGAYGKIWEKTRQKFAKYSSRAALMINATEAAATRNSDMFPQYAGSFVAVPFFLPGISAISVPEVREKQSAADPVRFIFVGSEGWRKGLDLVLAAWNDLPDALAASAHLTVISREMRPEWQGTRSFEFFESLPHAEVLAKMRAAHVFVMPSRRESFGFVYLEAMAAGCAVIGAPWESQREIFNEGVAGINCQPDANAVSEAMHLLIENETRRQDLAIAGHQRYLDRYTPEASALAYRKAIMSCL